MVIAKNRHHCLGYGRFDQRARNIGIIIDKDGYVVHPFVMVRRIAPLGRRPMDEINGIIVHQTGGHSLQGALASAAQRGGIGAHFYIDVDGTIIQAASLDRACGHVGLLKSRRLAEHRCQPDEAKRLMAMKPAELSKSEYQREFPDRYPSNRDSIGIELVGGYQDIPGKPEPVYDPVTTRQQMSLKWLVQVICKYRGVSATEVYRHPAVSWKVPTETVSAQW